MNAIFIAYEGRRHLLKYIFGDANADKRPVTDATGKVVAISPRVFDMMFHTKGSKH